MLNIELSIEWTEMPLELVIHGARNSCVVGIASVKEDGHDSATLLLPDYTKTQKTYLPLAQLAGSEPLGMLSAASSNADVRRSLTERSVASD